MGPTFLECEGSGGQCRGVNQSIKPSSITDQSRRWRSLFFVCARSISTSERVSERVDAPMLDIKKVDAAFASEFYRSAKSRRTERLKMHGVCWWCGAFFQLPRASKRRRGNKKRNALMWRCARCISLLKFLSRSAC